MIAALVAVALAAPPSLSNAEVGFSEGHHNPGTTGGGHLRIEAEALADGVRFAFAGTVLFQDDEADGIDDKRTWFRARRWRPLLGAGYLLDDGRGQLGLYVLAGPQLTRGTGGVSLPAHGIDSSHAQSDTSWNLYWNPVFRIRIWRTLGAHIYSSTPQLGGIRSTEWGFGLGYLR